jgi:predicted AAA+ superfamily ATPase
LRSTKLPLIVNGGKQIGKTNSIRLFGNASYKSFIEINFLEHPEYKSIFEDGYSTKDVIINISMINHDAEFIEGKTLIFFDELQACPQAITSLKPFAIDGRYDIICTGKLTSIQYELIPYTSAGYKEDYQMYSLDFEEFLWGLGYKQDYIESLYDRLFNIVPIPTSTHITMKECFLDYMITGGYPKAVNDFIAKKNHKESLPIEIESLNLIKEDIVNNSVYLNQSKVLEIFNSIPAQLLKRNSKFQFSKLTKRRSDNYIGCIEWLQEKELILKNNCLSVPNLPFNWYLKFTSYKLYYSDTVILISSLNEDVQREIILNRNTGVYNKFVYETAIANILNKQGYSLYYYKREVSSLNIDFFVRNTNYIIPIKVKTTSGNSKSLSTIIESDKYPLVKFGIKFGDYNIGYSNKILTLPTYLSFLLRRFLSECEKFENEDTI